MQLGGVHSKIGGVVAALFVAACTTAADRPPNIVVILADDYGYGSCGCYGSDGKLIQTPNIDRLAREGRRFTDANTTSSVCSPTRYSLVTGRYCWRTSLTHEVLGTFSPLHIETNRLTLASLLKRHGYGTAAVGKWHLGYGAADDSPTWRTDYTAELAPGPLDIGFDYHFGVPSNHGDLTGVFVENRSVYGLRSAKIPEQMKVSPVPDADNFKASYGPEDTENGKAKILELDAPRRKNERVMATLTDRAVRWLERQPKDTPFFLYFTPVAVHNPVTPDKDIAGQSKAGLYGDWIHELDRSVGGILEALDRLGVAQDTLVLFTSDNGGVFKPEREDTPQTLAYKAGLKVNGALKGGKHTVWDGGFKVPFIVRWPGKAKQGTTCNQMISLADVLATTAAIMGEPLPAPVTGAEDSVSFLPALLGDPAKPLRDSLIVHSADGVFAIRKGPWKWIEGEPVDEVKPGARKMRADEYKAQLYNTLADPAETKDVSAAHPEVVKELRDLLNRYRDGGYSRALPPPGVKPKDTVVVLPPLAGETVLNEPLQKMPAKPWITTGKGVWAARDGGVWGAQKGPQNQGAALTVPVALGDGVIDYELNLNGADRHSLRVEWSRGDRRGSFRVVVSRNTVELAKNPSKGEGADAVEPVARKLLKLQKNRWYPVRITLTGKQATVQVNEVVLTGSHEVFGQPKTQLNFLVFGDSAGFRDVSVAK
jgi:arylsulfatase A-like enzyme